MWISTRSRFSGAIVSGVTTKALTPSIVVFSILTFRRSVRPGRLRMVPAAPASETGFHSSPVFGRTFQPGRSAAAISFCTCGLTVSGTGSERVGTSKPPLLAGWAMAPGAYAATPATQIAPITARRSKDERSVIKLPPLARRGLLLSQGAGLGPHHRRSWGRGWDHKRVRRGSSLEPVPRLEHPAGDREAERQEDERHGDAQPDADVGDAVEAPAEAADEIDHRIGKRHGAPERRQHVDRVEAAAEEGQRRHDEERYELQLLEAVGPDADDEAEQAERHRRDDEEEGHPERMRDLQRHEQRRGRQNDEAEDDRLRRRRADIGEHDLEIRHRRRQE